MKAIAVTRSGFWPLPFSPIAPASNQRTFDAAVKPQRPPAVPGFCPCGRLGDPASLQPRRGGSILPPIQHREDDAHKSPATLRLSSGHGSGSCRGAIRRCRGWAKARPGTMRRMSWPEAQLTASAFLGGDSINALDDVDVVARIPDDAPCQYAKLPTLVTGNR